MTTDPAIAYDDYSRANLRECYFHSFTGKNLPRVTYRKFSKSAADCPNDAARRGFIDEFCKSLADLKLEGDWQKMKFFLPDYARAGLSGDEIGKVENALAQKRKRRNEKLLEVYPHCSDEFSTRIEFLDAAFGSERYGLFDETSRIFTLGSCFALNIAEHLRQKGFAVGHCDQAEDLNSPFSNAKMLAVCAAPAPLKAAYVEHWVRFLYPADKGVDFEAVIKNELHRLEKLAESLKSAEFLIITCGNVLDYFMTAAAASAGYEIGPPVAPKFLSISHDEDIDLRSHLTHKLKEAGSEFRLGTYPEAVAALDALYAAIRNINPHAPILLTLSPVPIGNALGIVHARKLGAIEIDCLSKSLLKAALDDVMERKKSDRKLFYFPSFEIVRWVGPCMDAAVLGKEDASSRHVSEHVLTGVYEYFIHKFGRGAAPDQESVMEHTAVKTEYSRQQPSERYRQLLEQYQHLHLHGTTDTKPEEMFAGISLPHQAPRIGMLAKRTKAQTLLDYGCGKGKLYQVASITAGNAEYPSIKAFWGVKEITLYDPAYPPYTELPQGKFDGVICTDVLEHCPEEDLPWILAELFSYARHFVFANIACYAAKRILPNGENAHCTIQPPAWWKTTIERIASGFPQVQYQFVVTEVALGDDGAVIRKESVIERIFRR